jgi:D-aspartate ligase
MLSLFKRCPTDTVAVLDAESPPGLAFTRSLGRGGIGVRVYSPKRLPVARLSRYCTGFGACPDPEDSEEFLPWLQNETARGRYSLVAPTSDLLAFYMAEFPEVFPEAQQRAMPGKEAVLNMLFKDRFDKTCRDQGIAVPYTRFPTSIDEALADADSYPYPVILKPKSHVGVGLARGVVVHNAAEMRQHYGPYPQKPKQAVIMQRFPELAWPMIQEYVPDALKSLFSISGLLGADGQVVAVSGSRKTLQWPPTLGVGVVFEGWDEPAAMQEGLRFVQAALGRGIFELEFIYDRRTQRYVAIDLNPRAHGHIAFDMARHNNLPMLWYSLATGAPLQSLPAATDGVRWIHGIPYHVGQIIGMATGPKRADKLRAYVSNLRGKTVDIIHDAHDPLPSLAHAAYMLRHPGGLIRPFLNEKVT